MNFFKNRNYQLMKFRHKKNKNKNKNKIMLQVKNRQIDMEKDGTAIPCPGNQLFKDIIRQGKVASEML
jgi:hypothetical protein